MSNLCDAYDDGKEYRQCIACEHICSDNRAWNENPPWPCPSCGRVGHWSDDVDWSSPERAMAELASEAKRLGLE